MWLGTSPPLPSLRTIQATQAFANASLASLHRAWSTRLAGFGLASKADDLAPAFGFTHVMRWCLMSCFFFLQLAQEDDLFFGGEFLFGCERGNGLDWETLWRAEQVIIGQI